MSALSEKIRFLMLDGLAGREIMVYYKMFKDSFSWSVERLEHYRNKKIHSLINHAYHNVPYYRRLLIDSGIGPDDIRRVEDLAAIPFLTRDLLRDNFTGLTDNQGTYRATITGSSSGTTGTPVRYIHDQQCESAGIAAAYALFHLSGYTLGKKRLHIWGNPSSVSRWGRPGSRLKRIITNQKNYPAFLLNDPGNYDDLLSLIRNYRPEFIDGYASSIGSFACWLTKNDIRLKGINAVFTTAENLIPLHRDAIERAIGPVSDLYGTGEINGIAIQPVNSGKYYILGSHVIVEQVDFNGYLEIVVTDLDSRLMPLIRYKPGDASDRIQSPLQGDSLPFEWFTRLEGRTIDFIKLTSGKVIHPVNLLGGTFLRKFPAIKRHKVVWDGRRLEFQVELAGAIDINALNAAISETLQEYDVSFIVAVKETLAPQAGGKYRYVEIIDQSRQ